MTTLAFNELIKQKISNSQLFITHFDYDAYLQV